MEQLSSLVSAILSPKCFEKYFLEFDFFDGDCFKALLSKCLGFAIIGGSLLVKVPQIMKILNNKSGEGLNIYAVFLDLFAITLNLSYSFVSGFPFSAYGDGAFLALQTVIIGCLVIHFSGSTSKAIAILSVYLSVCYVLMGGLTPLKFLWTMQACNIPILLTGKFVQALTNYRNSSTGQLSAATCFMLFFGAMARIFTSIQETGDTMMILTYALSTTANGVIVGQLLWYWNADKKKKDGEKDKKSKAKSKKIN